VNTIAFATRNSLPRIRRRGIPARHPRGILRRCARSAMMIMGAGGNGRAIACNARLRTANVLFSSIAHWKSECDQEQLRRFLWNSSAWPRAPLNHSVRGIGNTHATCGHGSYRQRHFPWMNSSDPAAVQPDTCAHHMVFDCVYGPSNALLRAAEQPARAAEWNIDAATSRGLSFQSGSMGAAIDAMRKALL